MNWKDDRVLEALQTAVSVFGTIVLGLCFVLLVVMLSGCFMRSKAAARAECQCGPSITRDDQAVSVALSDRDGRPLVCSELPVAL